MAYLTEEAFEMPDFDSFVEFAEYYEAQKEALDSIEEPIIRFPRADGYALYRVLEFDWKEPCDHCGRGGEPLLQHIPYGDAYKAASETINGLTTKDARRRVE